MADADGSQRQYMSDFEALMWTLEKSPALSNTFANVTILDRPPDHGRFIAKMQRATRKVPKLRQRPVEPAGRFSNPMWETDPDFDLHHHLRWTNLGGDADTRQLYDYVALLTGQPFDRERPLWDFTIIEGLAGGTAAMLQRMHHTITDGEGGIRLSVAFLDLERTPDEDSTADSEPEDDDTTTEDPPGGSGGSTSDGTSDPDGAPEPDRATSPATPQPEGSAVADMVGALAETLRQRGGQIVDALGTAGSFVLHPDEAAQAARSTGRQAQVLTRCSPLWTQRSLQRWFGTTSLDLARVREASHSMGGTVNDFFVAGAATAAGLYHSEFGAETAELRMSMPISIRRTDSEKTGEPGRSKGDPMAGGNAFTLSQLMVPTGEMAPSERFAEIHARLSATRSERASGLLDGAAAVMNLLPTAALLATGERATAGIDFVCSNVRAAPFALYMGGALMEANYPVGPLAGTAFNLTTMSYRGSLWLGLHVDSGAVQEPERLLELLETAYAELFGSAA